MTVKTGFGDQPAIPTIDFSTCRQCGLCAKVCGGQPLLFENGALTFNPNPELGCVGCGQCMAVCPNGSVTVRGRNLRPDDMLPLPSRDQCATPEQLESLLLARRSVRHYAPRTVERETVDAIIRMASTAPMGFPPSDVEILVFHGRDKVQALANDVLTVYEKSSRYLTPTTVALMRPFIGQQMADMLRTMFIPLMKLAKQWKEQGQDMLLYDAPLALLFHCSPCADPADCHIAATYAMLAAESLGLATCMLGDIAPAFDMQRRLRDHYHIPRANKLGIVLIAGYPAVRYQRALRRRFASVTFC